MKAFDFTQDVPASFAAAHGSPTPGEITTGAGSGMPLGAGGVF